MEPLAPGDPARIGPFRLVARLGRGGMGRVYLGRAESTGRAVAVKTIHGELLADPEFRTRFSHEVAAARRVRDEYIAEVVDADPDGPTPWLATAYVPGISVEDAVRRFGPLPAESVRILGVCVARAVAAIHAVGLVHRDLKPGNVLLTASGPKVIDFGIARGVSEAGITKTGMVSGSPPYMAPEQLNNGDFGPGSDVFSLGAILHYAATAAGPYGRGGAQEQYARALAVGPLLDAALPDSLTGIVSRSFVADPAARPSAAETARVLELHQGERPSPGWLPNAVVSDILAQATDALNKDSAAGLPTTPPPMPPPPRSAPVQSMQQPLPRPQMAAPPPQARVQHTRVQTPPPFAPPIHHPNTPHSSMPLPNTPHTPRPNAPYPNAPYSGTPPRPYPAQPQYPYQQNPYGQPGPGPMLPYGYRPTATDNGMATTALVLALVGIVVPCLLPIALPFGFIGMAKAGTLGVGRGQAISATIISAILLAGWIVIIALVASSN
jgi:eukaryotic-like serine/threonine-protein kinase